MKCFEGERQHCMGLHSNWPTWWSWPGPIIPPLPLRSGSSDGNSLELYCPGEQTNERLPAWPCDRSTVLLLTRHWSYWQAGAKYRQMCKQLVTTHSQHSTSTRLAGLMVSVGSQITMLICFVGFGSRPLWSVMFIRGEIMSDIALSALLSQN